MYPTKVAKNVIKICPMKTNIDPTPCTIPNLRMFLRFRKNASLAALQKFSPVMAIFESYLKFRYYLNVSMPIDVFEEFFKASQAAVAAG
jgi:hypothetical protein